MQPKTTEPASAGLSLSHSILSAEAAPSFLAALRAPR
jgi:hypothetical protein